MGSLAPLLLALLAGPPAQEAEAAPARGGHEVLLAVRGLPDEGGFATAFGAAGDVDGDGLRDFFVTAPYRAAGRQRRGSVRMVSSADGRTLWRADGEAFLERGPYQEGELGLLAVACGDADGDGVEDVLLAGLHRADDEARTLALHVLSGADGSHVRSLAPGWPDGGARLGLLGDVDGDGAPEVWVGLPAYEVDGEALGAVAVVSPSSGEVLATHVGRGGDFGAAAWGPGDGRLWVSSPAAEGEPQLWQLEDGSLGPVDLHRWDRAPGVWGEELAGGLGLYSMGVLHLDEGKTPFLLAASPDAAGYRVENYVPFGVLLDGPLEVAARTVPDLEAVPSFAGAELPAPRQFAVGWLDGQGRGHLDVHDYASRGVVRIEHHACGHPFGRVPRCAATDVDGDGRSELLVAVDGHFHGHPLSSQGEVQLVRWSPAAAPAPDPAAFDARVLRERGALHLFLPPRQVQGAPRRAGFGGDVRAAGDLDGDGVGDLLVGPWIAGEGSEQVLAFSGATGERLFAIVHDKLFGYAAAGDRDDDGRADLVVQSTDVPQRPGGAGWPASGDAGLPLGDGRAALFGWGQRVLAVGDLDGDGVEEVLVGAPTDSDGDGTAGPASARLHAGADGRELWRVDRGDRLDELGAALAVLGDVDGDGVADVALGAPSAAVGGDARDRRGAVLVVSGASGAVLHETTGAARGERFGEALCAVPDLDGDGAPDLAVGAPRGGDGRTGRVALLSGATGAPLRTISGRRPDELFGSALACADLDGDGADELVAGAPVAAHVWPLEFGRVYALDPRDGAEAWRLNDPPRREDCVRGDFGASLALPGDLDGDGRPELAVGAPYRRLDRDDGSVWIYRGAGLDDAGR